MESPTRSRAGLAVGVACGIRGLARCVTSPTLWPWALVPVLLTTAFVAVPAWLLHGTLDGWARGTVERWFGGGGEAVSWIVSVAFAVATIVLVYLVFAPFARVVSAPFLALLSDRVVRDLAGCDVPPGPGGPFARWILRPIGDALVFLGVRALVTICVLPLLLVPAAGPWLFLFAMVPLEGLDRMDVAQSSRALPLRRRLRFVRDHPGACVGLGLVAAGLLLVPVANVLLLPGLAVGAVLLDREVSPDFPRDASSPPL